MKEDYFSQLEAILWTTIHVRVLFACLFKLKSFDQFNPPEPPQILDIRDLKQHEAVKRTRRPNYWNLVSLHSTGMEIFLLAAASSRPRLNALLQSVSWSLAEFRHNKIVQSPHENYFNVCRQHKEKWDLVKMTIIQTGW